MASIKETLEHIKKQFVELFGSDVSDIRLEEIDESNNSECYLTLSFLIPNKGVSSALGDFYPYIRQYKNVVVDKNNGNIISIKMHNAA